MTTEGVSSDHRVDPSTTATTPGRWRTARSDLTLLVGPQVRARGRGAAFNAARRTELLWRRFGPGRGFDRPSSDLPLDVVIPAAEGDREVLALTVSGVRRNLRHPLGRIIVVARAGSEVFSLAGDLGCEAVDEDEVVALRMADLDYRAGGQDRSGWLFAQLVKLSADMLSGQDNVLVLDADTVLVRPQTFTRKGKVVTLVSSEYHLPYFSALTAVLGRAPASRVSFIAHHQVMNRRTLAGLKARIEDHCGRPWWRAILDACDYSEPSCFAEYELYGNYALSQDRSMVRRWWANVPVPRSELSSLDDLQRRYGTTHRTVSFHHYLVG